MMLGTWEGTAAAERGISGVNRGAACRFWGQSSRGGDALMRTSGSLGVKEPAFLKISQADSGASAEGWPGRRGVGSVQKTGSLAAAAGCP